MNNSMQNNLAKWSLVAVGVLLTIIASLALSRMGLSDAKASSALNRAMDNSRSIALLQQQTANIQKQTRSIQSTNANTVAILQSITLKLQRIGDKQDRIQNTQNRLLDHARP